MKVKIEIKCKDEKDLIKHLQKILIKVKNWGGKKESEGLYFTEDDEFGKRRVEIDSDL